MFLGVGGRRDQSSHDRNRQLRVCFVASTTADNHSRQILPTFVTMWRFQRSSAGSNERNASVTVKDESGRKAKILPHQPLQPRPKRAPFLTTTTNLTSLCPTFFRVSGLNLIFMTLLTKDGCKECWPVTQVVFHSLTIRWKSFVGVFR